MIAFLKGKIIDTLSDNTVILDVNGVGYEVEITGMGIKIGEECRLYIYTSFSTDAIHLYGFNTNDDLEVFKQLISVNKIGPKLAMSLLTNLSVSEIIEAIVSEDEKKLQVKGVGIKTAKRIVLDLKDKYKDYQSSASSAKGGGFLGKTEEYIEALEGLVALGYTKNEIDNVISKIEINDEDSTQIIIKKVLANLR